MIDCKVIDIRMLDDGDRLVDLPDSALVERSRKGEVEAFNQLVRRHHTVVYNLAFRFMRDHTLAEDMTQETFLKAFRMLRGFRGDCAFSSWLYRVTCSVCLTELDRRKRRHEVELKPQMGGTVHENGLERKEMAEIVRRCVSKLPKKYATLVMLYYLNEIPYNEIAHTMQIPMGTLKTWMHRARKKLKKIVEQELERNEAI